MIKKLFFVSRETERQRDRETEKQRERETKRQIMQINWKRLMPQRDNSSVEQSYVLARFLRQKS